MGYNIPEDIANRALQHCGIPPSNRITSLTDNTKNAKECALVYNKVRQAELRENNWKFSIYRTALRAVDSNTLIYKPPTYNPATTYAVGDIVAYTDPVDNTTSWWLSTSPGNLANTPGSRAAGSYTVNWCNYWGPVAASLYDSSTTYFSGELVYTTPGDGSYTVYVSLQSANADAPGTVEAYDATVTYKINDIVVSGGINYISLVDLNLNKTPASNPTQWQVTATSVSRLWRKLTGTLSELNLIYPVGAGPSTQAQTKNIFPLPYGFLRVASQDPKAGSTTLIGSPTNIGDSDWLMENGYIVTAQSEPIILRFSCDWTDVQRMDPLFCESLAARIAYEVCESLTQSSDKLKMITGLYSQAVTKAKVINGIEIGYEEPSLDDYIACRA